MLTSKTPGLNSLIIRTFFVAVLLWFGNSSADAMSDEVRGMCQQAEQLIGSGRMNDAIKVLNRANSMDPNCAEVHGYLGQAYQNSSNTKQAVDEYLKALQLNPQMSFININLGTCYLNLNQPDMAVPYLKKYLQTNPSGPEADQARAYIQQAGSRKGQQGLRSAVEQGQALLNQKRYAEAQNAFAQAVQQQPNFAPAHFYLGFCMAQSGQHQQAIAEFQSALQLDPSMNQATMNIASNYQSMGDCKNAIAWYQRYLQENPNSPKSGDIRSRISGLQKQMQQQTQPGPGTQPGAPDNYLSSAANGGKYFRWSLNAPISVWIDSGQTCPGYNPSYRQALIDAFSAWALASGNKFAFTMAADPAQSNIYCDWTADPNAVMQAGSAVEGGLTKLNGQPLPNGSDVAITQVRMTILTNRGGTPLSDNDMKKICLHEAGHAVGLNGHSNNNQDIMFFSENPATWPILSQRDQNTIRLLYMNYPPVPTY